VPLRRKKKYESIYFNTKYENPRGRGMVHTEIVFCLREPIKGWWGRGEKEHLNCSLTVILLLKKRHGLKFPNPVNGEIMELGSFTSILWEVAVLSNRGKGAWK